MKSIKYIIIGMFAVLAIVGCGRSTGSEDLSHDEVRAVNAWVLEKAISQPDSALMMIALHGICQAGVLEWGAIAFSVFLSTGPINW